MGIRMDIANSSLSIARVNVTTMTTMTIMATMTTAPAPSLLHHIGQLSETSATTAMHPETCVLHHIGQLSETSATTAMHRETCVACRLINARDCATSRVLCHVARDY